MSPIVLFAGMASAAIFLLLFTKAGRAFLAALVSASIVGLLTGPGFTATAQELVLQAATPTGFDTVAPTEFLLGLIAGLIVALVILALFRRL